MKKPQIVWNKRDEAGNTINRVNSPVWQSFL